MPRSKYLCFGIAVALAMLAIPSLALGDAKVSRSGNTITLTSDGDGDEISSPGTDNSRVVSLSVERGKVLRAGHGCHRLRGPRVTKVIVLCGPPSQNENINRVTLKADLGGGDDQFFPAPWDDVQPRIIADGGEGNDEIWGTVNADEIEGGPGNDRLWGLDDVDNIKGGDGNDTLVGGAGDDALEGGGDADFIHGDEPVKPTGLWGNDVIVSAADFTPDLLGVSSDTVDCGNGPDDSVVADKVDLVASDCENLSGGQTSPPRDTVGTTPVAVTIGALAPPVGGLGRVLRGQPIRIPIKFSAAATIAAELNLSAAEARRLGVPAKMRTIAVGIGTPLTIIPIEMNSQIRILWAVRKYLADADRVKATLTVRATDANLHTTTASKAIVLHR